MKKKLILGIIPVFILSLILSFFEIRNEMIKKHIQIQVVDMYVESEIDDDNPYKMVISWVYPKDSILYRENDEDEIYGYDSFDEEWNHPEEWYATSLGNGFIPTSVKSGTTTLFFETEKEMLEAKKKINSYSFWKDAYKREKEIRDTESKLKEDIEKYNH